MKRKTPASSRASLLRTMSYCVGLVVAGALAWSSIAHLNNLQLFFLTILRYDVVSGVFAGIFAILLLTMQFVLAVTLSANFQFLASLKATSILLCFFVINQIVAIGRGLKIACGCFGSVEEPIGVVSIGRTTIFLVACLVAIKLSEVANEKEALADGGA